MAHYLCNELALWSIVRKMRLDIGILGDTYNIGTIGRLHRYSIFISFVVAEVVIAGHL